MPDAYWRVSSLDAVLIRMRLESFVRARFGSSVAGRPRVPMHEWRWRSTLDAPDLSGFVWNTYADAIFPRAVGLRTVTNPRQDAVYEVAVWYGPEEIRRSHWQFQALDGWTQLMHTERLGR